MPNFKKTNQQILSNTGFRQIDGQAQIYRTLQAKARDTKILLKKQDFGKLVSCCSIYTVLMKHFEVLRCGCYTKHVSTMNKNPGLQFFNQNVLAIRQLVPTIKSVCQEDFQKQLHMCIKKNPFTKFSFSSRK